MWLSMNHGRHVAGIQEFILFLNQLNTAEASLLTRLCGYGLICILKSWALNYQNFSLLSVYHEIYFHCIRMQFIWLFLFRQFGGSLNDYKSNVWHLSATCTATLVFVCTVLNTLNLLSYQQHYWVNHQIFDSPLVWGYNV